jgi:general secretion pathway protein I
MLELVVAFTLMALIISVLLRVFSGGLLGIGLAEDYARATSVAESTLARVGADIELKPGSNSGEVDGRYAWTVDIRPHDLQDPAPATSGGTAGTSSANTLPVVLHDVVVNVAWSEYGRDRSVRLQTLRVGPRT